MLSQDYPQLKFKSYASITHIGVGLLTAITEILYAFTNTNTVKEEYTALIICQVANMCYNLLTAWIIHQISKPKLTRRITK